MDICVSSKFREEQQEDHHYGRHLGGPERERHEVEPLLLAVPDWRWLIESTDSPWYPTMRIFRQQTPGDWPEVLGRVAAELAIVLASPGTSD